MQLFYNYAYIIDKVKFQFQWDKNYNCNMLKTFFNFSFFVTFTEAYRILNM